MREAESWRPGREHARRRRCGLNPGQGGFADNPAEHGLQFALDGLYAGLDLPTVEISPVVGNGQSPRPALLRRGLGRFSHGYQCR